MPKFYNHRKVSQNEQRWKNLSSTITLGFKLILFSYEQRKKYLPIYLDNLAKISVVLGSLLMIFFLLSGIDWPYRIRFFLLGIFLLAVGLGWIENKQKYHNKKNEEETAKNLLLDDLFYKVVNTKQGEISLFEWVSVSHLPRIEAEEYLKQKAIEWDATIDVSETGAIIYRFPYS